MYIGWQWSIYSQTWDHVYRFSLLVAIYYSHYHSLLKSPIRYCICTVRSYRVENTRTAMMFTRTATHSLVGTLVPRRSIHTYCDNVYTYRTYGASVQTYHKLSRTPCTTTYHAPPYTVIITLIPYYYICIQASNDDLILQSSLNLRHKLSSSSVPSPPTSTDYSIMETVVLLTDDRNLRVKAHAANVIVKDIPHFMDISKLS